ncbi:flagellar biosynthesis protein FlhF [Nevskia soli]|uniref:flagellar biosynthesis protein FlhF n=1 Tax=Nevskia soli TaxID=418856 RepID=UPI0004A749D7|nr:flagellar biosynthesis protein FlhF [Nevskia soli]
MKIKRFVAKSMRDAIRQVRDEQGPDAVILSNRRVPGGVEVVAATDYDAALAQQALRQHAAHEPQPPPPPPQTPPEKPRRSTATQRPTEAAAPAAQQAATAPPPSELAQMQRELGSMRRLLEEQLAGLQWNELKRNQPQRVAVLRALDKLGLSADLARAIADEVPPSVEGEAARLLPASLLARRIPIGPQDPILDGGVIALVGPTGVGKTTTIAKLAARFARHNRARDIALVTLDHYRIGAQEQLFSYGRLLGVPVHSVAPDQDLGAVLEQLSDRRLVLVDTAGMSQRDHTLGQQIDRLRSLGPRLHSYVVLAANASGTDEVVRRFAPLQPAGCVLTKLDEATSIGAPLSAVIGQALPLSYVAHGQRVPEDLHLAHADRLVLCAVQLARATTQVVDDDSLARRYSNPSSSPAASIHA